MKSFAILVTAIIGFSVFLKFCVINAPLVFLVAWMIVLIGTPIIWTRYGGGTVINFWKGNAIRFLKICLCIFLFLLLRSFGSYLVGFTPFSNFVTYTRSTAPGMLLGYPPTTILFEALFILIFGFTTMEAVFGNGSTKKAAFWGLGVIFGSLLIGSTVMFASKTITNQTTANMSGPEFQNAVQTNGVIGGPGKQIWKTAFGEGWREVPGAKIKEIQPNYWEVKLETGKEAFILTRWKKEQTLTITTDAEIYRNNLSPTGGDPYKIIPGSPLTNLTMDKSLALSCKTGPATLTIASNMPLE